MDNNTENRTPILNIAWSRFAQLDAAAEKLENPHYGIRRWIFILGVFASLFAVLTEVYPDDFPAVGKIVIKVLLILSPITASVLAAFFNSTSSLSFIHSSLPLINKLSLFV